LTKHFPYVILTLLKAKTPQMKRFLSLLISVALLLSIQPAAHAFWIWTPGEKKLENPKYAVKDTPEEQFAWAMKFYQEKDYKQAAEEFSRLARAFQNSDLAPEAQYYAGRSYDAGNRHYQAFKAYQRTVDLYPFTTRVDEIIEREYKLGEFFFEKSRGNLMGMDLMMDLDWAVEIFTKVRENAPFGPYADKAQYMIGESYKKAQQYQEAIPAFQRLMEEYPSSYLYDYAQYELAQCTYLASRSPEYDQNLTDEAIREFSKFAATGSDPDVTEVAEDTLMMLKEKKAQSILKTALFYQKQKRYKSAAIYFNEVIKEFPETDTSKEASLYLQSIQKFLDKGI